MRLRAAEDQFIQALEELDEPGWLAVEWIYCKQVLGMFAEELVITDVELCEESLALIGECYEGRGTDSTAVELLDRWRVRNASEDGSTGVVNVRFVFEDIIGAVAGQCPRGVWLDRFSYPLVYHPTSPLNSGVTVVSNLEINDERAVRIFGGLIASVQEVKNLQGAPVAELELIRIRCFDGSP